VFRFSLQLLSETFFTVRKQRHTNRNVYWSSCKAVLFSSHFNGTWHYFDRFSKNIKFHENPSSGSRVVPCGRTDGRRTDVQTDVTKLIFAFCNISKASKKSQNRLVYLYTI